MAIIHTNFQNTAAFQNALDVAALSGANLDGAINQGGAAFSEFEYGEPFVTFSSSSLVQGYISNGGTFEIQGYNLDAPPATVTYMRYNDNSPAAVLEVFGNITITEFSESGSVSRVFYDSASVDFDLRGNIDIQYMVSGATYDVSSFSMHVASPSNDVLLSFEGAIQVNYDALSGTVSAASLEVDGQYIRATGLDHPASLLDSTDAGFVLSSMLDGDDTIFGEGINQELNGFAGADSIFGGDGNDTLDGGTGTDLLTGGLGNDTYVVDSAADALVDAGGSDTVVSSVAWTLAANFENLTLAGSSAISGTGNALANDLVGNDAANVLNGSSGADTLTGGAGNDTLAGGAGIDELRGGEGDDTYVVDSGDIITELAGQGIDTFKSAVSRTLAGTPEIENLVLAGTAAINGTGNDQANRLTGNTANNSLRGVVGNDTLVGGSGDDTLDGGTGDDSLNGGAGNDTYLVDSLADTLSDASGIDTVKATLDWTLGAGTENLVLVGTAALKGTGNGGNNKLTGNAQHNTLAGGLGNDTLVGGGGNDTLIGGAGTDSLAGGIGHDTYVIDAFDTLVEGVGEGIDTIKVTISHVLGSNFENLFLTGTDSVDGTGNELANTLTGNSGANRLDGLLGSDTLNGGGGADVFVFTTPLDGSIDTIKGFGADDSIELDNAVFTSLTSTDGKLEAGTFRVGPDALDGNDFILYEKTTGALYYDADGSGTGVAKIQFATLWSSTTAHPGVFTADFVVS